MIVTLHHKALPMANGFHPFRMWYDMYSPSTPNTPYVPTEFTQDYLTRLERDCSEFCEASFKSHEWYFLTFRHGVTQFGLGPYRDLCNVWFFSDPAHFMLMKLACL